MGRFSYNTDNYKELKKKMKDLGRPYIFLTLDADDGMHCTENLSSFELTAEESANLYSQMGGAIYALVLDTVKEKLGVEEANKRLVRATIMWKLTLDGLTDEEIGKRLKEDIYLTVGEVNTTPPKNTN